MKEVKIQLIIITPHFYSCKRGKNRYQHLKYALWLFYQICSDTSFFVTNLLKRSNIKLLQINLVSHSQQKKLVTLKVEPFSINRRTLQCRQPVLRTFFSVSFTHFHQNTLFCLLSIVQMLFLCSQPHLVTNNISSFSCWQHYYIVFIEFEWCLNKVLNSMCVLVPCTG